MGVQRSSFRKGTLHEVINQIWEGSSFSGGNNFRNESQNLEDGVQIDGHVIGLQVPKDGSAFTLYIDDIGLKYFGNLCAIEFFDQNYDVKKGHDRLVETIDKEDPRWQNPSWDMFITHADYLFKSGVGIIRELYVSDDKTKENLMRFQESLENLLPMIQRSRNYFDTLEYKLFHRKGSREQLQVSKQSEIKVTLPEGDIEDLPNDANTWENVVSQALNLNASQTLIIPAELFPSGKSDAALKKKLQLLTVPRYDNQTKKMTAKDALNSALSSVSLGDVYVGYDWQGVKYTRHDFRVSTLHDAIRAYLLDDYLKRQGNSPHVKLFSEAQENLTQGGVAVVEVPSITVPGKTYSVRLEHIAFHKSQGVPEYLFPLTYDLHPIAHDCERTRWLISLGRMTKSGRQRTGDETLLDFHVALAMRRAVAEIEAVPGMNYKVSSPLLNIIREDTIDYFRKLYGNFLVQDADKLRNLTDFEMEIMLFKKIGYDNLTREKKL
jgi:hypothetical protein